MTTVKRTTTRKVAALFLAVFMNCLSLQGMSIIAYANDNASAKGDSSKEIVSIYAGANVSAAIREDGSVWMWGYNKWGIGYASRRDVPRMVVSGDAKSIKLQKSYSRYYAGYDIGNITVSSVGILKNDNTLWMCGSNDSGQIGNGEFSYTNVSNPYKVLGDKKIVSFDVSASRSAAVTTDGDLYMWGRLWNASAYEGTERYTTPVLIANDVKTVSLADNHCAIIKNDNSLWMWGSNLDGQLGIGTFSGTVEVPTKVMDDVKAVSLGREHSAAITMDGSLWTWGQNQYGQLGVGYLQDKNVPVKVDLSDVAVVELSEDHSAAIQKDGTLWMWGSSGGVIPGNNTGNPNTRPIKVDENIKSISIGHDHALCLREDGTLLSWGYDYFGQLGTRDGAPLRDGFGTVTLHQPEEVKLGQFYINYSAEGVEEKKLDVAWDETDLFTSPERNEPNADLAIAGTILSEWAYKGELWKTDGDIRNNLGYYPIEEYLTDWIDKPNCYVFYKIISDYDDPQLIMLMIIKGTSTGGDWFTDIKGINDGFVDAGDYCFDCLKKAKEKIEWNYRNKYSFTSDNTKLFITGHSLGGACAALTGIKMCEGGFVRNDNLYVYTYASPKYSVNGIDKQKYEGIYNFINCEDAVPRIPDFMIKFKLGWFQLFEKEYLSRVGKDIIINMNGSRFDWIINYLYGEIPWDLHYSYKKRHFTPVYLSGILANRSFSVVKQMTQLSRIISVHCPVEVEVYNKQNELLAYTNEGNVLYPQDSEVRITIINDEKFVELFTENEYRIKYIGTDSGKMQLEDQVINDEEGTVESEKRFENVTLAQGKTFESEIEVYEDMIQTQLFVTDEGGESLAVVQEDGTELPLNRVLTIVNKTGNTPIASIDGVANQNEYIGDVEFDVTCDKPCVVAYSEDDGKTYTRLSSKAQNGNKRTFEMSIDADTKLFVGLIGDVTLDGRVDPTDATQAARFYVNLRSLSEEQKLVSDVTSDGKVDPTDATQICRYYVGLRTFNW